MSSPYRHSVWIDVFGVLLFGAVLLGGAGYLLYHAGGAAGSLGASISGRSTPAAAQGSRVGGARSAHRPRGFTRSRPGSGPLLGNRSGPSASGTQAPFSADWRERATPDLADPSTASSGGDARGERIGSGSPGPSITSSRPSGKPTGGGASESEAGGSSWRAEARRLAGRARALGNQLGHVDRSSSKSGEANSSRERALRSAEGTGAAASGPGTPGGPTRRSDPGSPSDVPIGDHLDWLAVAGLLWGVWRLS